MGNNCNQKLYFQQAMSNIRKLKRRWACAKKKPYLCILCEQSFFIEELEDWQINLDIVLP